MADNVENNAGNTPSLEDRIGQKVAQQTPEQLKEELNKLSIAVEKIKFSMAKDIQAGKPIHDFGSDKDDLKTERGKANSITEFVQKMFYAAKKAPEKLPVSEKPTELNAQSAPSTPESTKILQKLSENINIEDIDDQTAPYFYDLLKSITTGSTSVKDIARVVNESPLQLISPTMFANLQKAGADYAVMNGGIPEVEAKKMFNVVEGPRQTVDDSGEWGISNENFNMIWQQAYYGSYFDNGKDRELIKALYAPKEFLKYYDKVKTEVITDETSSVFKKGIDSQEVGEAASKRMEIDISLLFAKLYTKLDHDKPQEFFQTIEGEDMIKGITPVKAELKRRITLLSQSLRAYEETEEGKKRGQTTFYRRLEEDPETVAINVGTDEDGKPILKPRVRLKTTLEPKASGGYEFTHYLEQVVDHYIEARKYTHNSRAIFLHPPDPQKGFYGQLAGFAAEMTTLDFDQMMLLPDNDIFQSAFGLYNKMIEEGFAKHDWRHPATMFTQKENEHLTPIESKIMEQLGSMYKGIPEERLAAALTMAVGASRGMFLTEVEMAAYADPHLDEKGGSTFTSYYNQDNAALNAFNPMHTIYRFFGSPNMLDPIFFLPLDNPNGLKNQAYDSHYKLWDKAKAYKESFLKGREALHGDKTFADMMVNIGLVGGPMQRKGWRTAWQLDSLYIDDKDPTTGAMVTDHLKTFQHLENIGYEVLQDYVTKLGQKIPDADFFIARDTPSSKDEHKKLARQKDKLFKYIFKKYFDKEPEDLGKYLDKLRAEKTDKAIKDIQTGKIAPPDIKGYVEGEVSKVFLDRALARVIMQRIPSKILRMDRDRLSLKGTSRWKQVMKDMGMDGQFDTFDAVMQDMILAEQLLRKEVSGEMNKLRDSNALREKYGKIEYVLTQDKIKALLTGKDGMTQDRIDKVVELYDKIQNIYSKVPTGKGKGTYQSRDEFIDKELVKYFKNGAARDRETKFTIALDETDLSFVPFRGGGQSVLARSIRDIANVEENITKPLSTFISKLRAMAIDGKQDFNGVIEIMQKAYGAMDGIISTDYANEVVSKLASMTIMYMKKDTRARALGGVFGIGKLNSMAAESAGRGTGVWEWDSREIDRFIVALESRSLLPRNPYNMASNPTYEARYVNIPLVKEPVKLPEKIELTKWFGKEINLFGKIIKISDIPLFQRRKADFTSWSKNLRDNFGGSKIDIAFDILNKYLPFILILFLLKQMKDAMEASEGKKK